jgi:hypothetical protein
MIMYCQRENSTAADILVVKLSWKLNEKLIITSYKTNINVS